MSKYIIILLAFLITLIPVPSSGQFSSQVSVEQPVANVQSVQAPSKPEKPKSTAPKPKPPKSKPVVVQKPKPVVKASGTCEEWIAQAGITDKVNARELIRRESQCKPHAVNPSSGACGVAQELPCGKSGCKRGDGACQVKWMSDYVKSRYGSFANAIAHHNLKDWY